jgi:ABC-type antimicrobial peptide transport system permease subunit
MNLRLLARRSFRFHFRSHLGVLAGAALAATVLIGALAVGDSVQQSLKIKAWQRIGAIAAAIQGGDRFFRSELLFREYTTAAVLDLPATITRQDGTARANRVHVLGIRRDFGKLWQKPYDNQTVRARSLELGDTIAPDSPFTLITADRFNPTNGSIHISQALAHQLNAKVGDALVLRIHKPSALSRDAVITPRDDQSVALRVTVGAVFTDAAGNFSLEAGQSPPMNAFIDLDQLAVAAGIPKRANLLLWQGAPQASSQVGTRIPFSLRLHDLLFRAWIEAGNRGYPFIAQSIDKVMSWMMLRPGQERWKLGSAANDLPDADRSLQKDWTLEDAELSVRNVNIAPRLSGGEAVPKSVELITRRIFLEAPAVRAALTNDGVSKLPAATPILTYLVNSLSVGDAIVPYSMVTAAGAPYTPSDLRDDEIVVNEWLATDLKLKPGDSLAVAYYRVDAGTQLVERTNTFRVRSIVPLRGLHADRTLMPEFPGLAKAESTRDWDAGFDLIHPIRDKDEAYWKQWRGTPKAFISLAAGQAMWGNRFGNLTAIRWPLPTPSAAAGDLAADVSRHVRSNLDPAEVGLQFRDIRTPALAAAETGTGKEFGGLMIGFSFFLIVSALLLTAMLFSFSLDQRAVEIGTLLAIGWQPKQVRRVLFREGLMISILGTLIGTLGGIGYARGVLWGLGTLWRDAVAGAGLEFHLSGSTLATGVLSSIAVAALTLALELRRQTQRPARELLNEGSAEPVWTDPSKRSAWPRRIAWVFGLGSIGMAGASIAMHDSNPETFFSAGSLLLIALLLGAREWLARPASSSASAQAITLRALSLRGMTRRSRRSLGTLSLLGSAAFLIVAVATNRLDARRDATQRSSGTGGFALWAESSLPIVQDLNARKGQEFYGLDSQALKDVSFVPLRVRDGDEASCLNLNKAQRPRLLGVNPELLAQRGAFTFTGLAPGITVTNGWLALGPAYRTNSENIPVIPAIGDANSLQWALQKSLGETIDYTDERGRPFRVRLVGAVANSVLQGSLIISEADFTRHFANEAGFRALMIDAPPATAGALAAQLSRSMQDNGLEITTMAARLDRFNAVQNTYLNTFQILGGLGLLLGSVGLGVVVSRNVFERRGELAVLQAMGFEASVLRRFVLVEHGALLTFGLGIGAVAALITVLPALLTPGSEFPWGSLALTLGIVAVNGLAWTWGATRRSLRKPLLDSLKAL